MLPSQITLQGISKTQGSLQKLQLSTICFRHCFISLRRMLSAITNIDETWCETTLGRVARVQKRYKNYPILSAWLPSTGVPTTIVDKRFDRNHSTRILGGSWSRVKKITFTDGKMIEKTKYGSWQTPTKCLLTGLWQVILDCFKGKLQGIEWSPLGVVGRSKFFPSYNTLCTLIYPSTQSSLPQKSVNNDWPGHECSVGKKRKKTWSCVAQFSKWTTRVGDTSNSITK